MLVTSIVIYGTMSCPYCNSAKQLLKERNIQYTEILIDKDQSKRAEMLEKTGGKRGVPQIFINNKHIGGYDDLKSLDQKGKLREMLDSKN